MITALIVAAALATTPITGSTKAPFKETKNYCNADDEAGKPLNIVCYNHDVCYSDPDTAGRLRNKDRSRATRMKCDNWYRKDCNKVASAIKCTINYLAIRAGGFTSWARSRSNDNN